MRRTVRFRSRLPVPAGDAFAWHARDGAFERLAPPWQRLRVIDRRGGITDRGTLEFRVQMLGPLGGSWVARHGDFEPDRYFTDWQVRGPFAEWSHTHRFTPDGSDGCILTDEVQYQLPFGTAGDLAAGRRVRAMLGEMFLFRHLRTRLDLLRHASVDNPRPLRIAITGSSGTIGSQLVPFLTSGGHDVVRLVRRQPGASDEAYWNPESGEIDLGPLEGLDAVVHLAGEPVGSLIWTEGKKRAVRDSRVDGTRFLAETLARLADPPGVLISASGIGYYGNERHGPVDEDAESGDSFLASVCKDWEAATEPASQAGIRVVRLRIGVVLSGTGGLLPVLALPFRFGVGGHITGNEGRYVSWIDLDDLLGIINHTLYDRRIDGPVNAVAPQPVTDTEFGKALAQVLDRPATFRVPGAAVRGLLGEMAGETVLASQNVASDRILAYGYRFAFSDLERSLRFQLGRQRSRG